MAQAAATDFCNRHPDQVASGRCDQCGTPYCSSCVVEDVGAEEEFCSADCRDRRIGARPTGRIATQEELLASADRPFINGWKLWARSFPTLCRHGLLFALGGVLLSSAIHHLVSPWTQTDRRDLSTIVLLGFGMALSQVILTQKHTGLIQGAPLSWTAQRFGSWILANGIVVILSIIGGLALILPGIYVGLKLFWADEFAMVHRKNPLQALQASWRLTEGEIGSLFRFQFLVGLSLYLLLLPPMVIIWIMANQFGDLHLPAHLEWVLGPLKALVFFLGYAALHAPEVVHFYGIRARKSQYSRKSNTLGID